MTLGQFTDPKLLIPRLHSEEQDAAIRELTQRLEAGQRLANPAVFLEALLKRERELPTFIGDGVAVPHVRSQAVTHISLAVGLSQAGIPWGRGQPNVARLVFLFALPLEEPGTYLRLLSTLSRLVGDESAFAALTRATEPEQMLVALNSVRLPVRQVGQVRPV
jgi:mannitol/fructose-specific phosphotransferase system IIA component (Ntr-type)